MTAFLLFAGLFFAALCVGYCFMDSEKNAFDLFNALQMVILWIYFLLK